MKYTDVFLTPNKYSRPGIPMERPKAIVLHWFMNPGTSALSARNWWERRVDGKNGYGSAHVAIDDNNVLRAVPFHEVAYHVGALHYTKFANDHIGKSPNFHCLGIELAHADMTGKPSQSVWDKAVDVAADICRLTNLKPDAIVTHFDITGMLDKWNGIPDHPWFNREAGEMARFRFEVGQRI